MNGCFLITCLIIIIGFWAISTAAQGIKNLQINNLRKCNKNASYGLEIRDAVYKTEKNIFRMNATFNVVTEITEPFKVS